MSACAGFPRIRSGLGFRPRSRSLIAFVARADAAGAERLGASSARPAAMRGPLPRFPGSRSIFTGHHAIAGSTNPWTKARPGIGWRSWDRDDGLVLDSIVVDSADPATIYVGAWKRPPTTADCGSATTAAGPGARPRSCKGQPVHALAQAPSDPHILYAGTLEGVFRSSDGGATWAQISPPGSHEIHEIESLAVDPANPDIVYAGTWHLPWKTTDGGKTWHNIKQGLIVDSDVFSIIVDPGASAHRLPERVQRNLQERKRGHAVPQDPGHSRPKRRRTRS